MVYFEPINVRNIGVNIMVLKISKFNLISFFRKNHFQINHNLLIMLHQ